MSRPDAGPSAPLRVAVSPRVAEAVPAGLPLRYEAVSLDDGTRRAGALPIASSWPLEAELPGVVRGTWRVTVFLDRDGDTFFDDCPFPPRAGDSEQAPALDTLSGQVVVRALPERVVEVLVEQRICGPGAVSTGLSGLVALKDGEAVAGPVMALLEPVGQSVEPGEARPLPDLRITLRDGALDEALPFSLGEILPGRWRLTVFEDTDGDATPTPCDVQPGGGDRHVSLPVEVDVVAGQRVVVPEPVVLRALDCPAQLTGLRGEVSLAAGLPADPGLDGPLGPLEGPLRLALFRSSGGEPVATTTLLAAVDARPLPHRFTVTGLPEGSWRLVAWIDRDGDGAFTPCGGLTGIDATWLQREDVRVVAGEVRAVEPLALVRQPCDPASETGLTGRILLPTEDGPVGSGRPVRARLVPRGGGPERSLQLLDNHRAAAPSARVIASRLPPGRYDLIVYLDSDQDGVFTDCRQAPYGDRAAVALDDVDIPEGRIVSLGTPTLSLLGCMVPHAELRPRVVYDPAVVAEEGPLRLIITERGGWREQRLLAPRSSPVLPEPLLEPLTLAPGEYQLEAWLDVDRDERLGGCGDAAEDPAVARLVLRLDAVTPEADPFLRLEPPCGR